MQKVLSHVRAYIKRLSDTAQLEKLVPADVPLKKARNKVPVYLTKDELASFMNQLEKNLAISLVSGEKHSLYAAHLRRAVSRMLYTTGLRNYELRSLTDEDLRLHELSGTVLGKWKKYSTFTYSEKTKKALEEYLKLREQYFPETKFRYIFTLYEKGAATKLTEQKLNIALKKIAKQAKIKQNVHAHLFRHTLATHLIMYYNRSLVDVRDKLRHSNIAVTSVYLASNSAAIRSMTSTLWNDLMA
jgi:integrase/recombinase XerC